MEGFKEFQGKSLDEAINEACTYFDAPRERLEIDIVQDAKSGIFGLVGARKAKVRARRVQLRTAVEDILGRNKGRAEKRPEQEETAHQVSSSVQSGTAPEEKAPAKEKHGRQHADSDKSRNQRSSRKAPVQHDVAPAAVQTDAEAASGHEQPSPAAEKQNTGRKSSSRHENETNGRRKRGGRRPQDEGHERAPRQQKQDRDQENFTEDHDDSDDLQRIPFDQLDQERLCALSLEAVGKLVTPIVGDMPMSVSLEDGRVCVRLDCGDDSGLLIGREGQTLASLQYLASRIVSRGMSAAVRVQLDAGEYRLRQDEKLREMALALAEKVRATGKSHSTRPLSSYHRRIVHVALQDMQDVQTRSSGDGALKRVIIQRKRG